MDEPPDPGTPSTTTTIEVTHQARDAAAAYGIERRHLLVFNGTSSSMYQLPPAGRIIIGRAETADLRIDEASVSRQHAEVVIDGDAITIADLGSSNGTFVNGAKIAAPTELHAGDAITIHKTTLVVHTTAALRRPPAIVELQAFRDRVEDEVDRAVRYERSASILCLVWPAAIRDPAGIERVVAEHLRRIDAATWSPEGALYLLIAETAGEDAAATAAQIRARLEATGPRVGRATCPEDGYDVAALLASAYNAARAAGPGAIGGSTSAFQTRTIGAQRIVIADPEMMRLYALSERLAVADLPILISGETGSGKELIALALHQHSQRGSKPLISVNCATIQDTLADSVLFGHDKGSYTGAVASKAGLLEAASGSTLFFDEIADLSPAIQAKLLRVLETRRVSRVGEIREREIDVRILAASHRDLATEVAAGRFREDLFYRLSAATLHVPPLRQRPRELPLLAQALLDDVCRTKGRSMMAISDAAMAVLCAHPWPGNVRELKNVMGYVAAMHGDDVLTAEHVADRLVRPVPAPPAPRTEAPAPDPTSTAQFRPLADEIRELEITRMREALEAAGGNRTRAAELLSMSIRTFFDKARHYGLPPRRKRDP